MLYIFINFLLYFELSNDISTFYRRIIPLCHKLQWTKQILHNGEDSTKFYYPLRIFQGNQLRKCK